MRKKLLILFCFLLSVAQLWAQGKIVTGTVKNDQNVPLSGASVVVKGTQIGTTTDANGTFSLSVPANARTLSVSYQGYVLQDLTIGNRSSFDVSLNTGDQNLTEIVVIGYGTQNQKNQTQATSVIRASEFTNQPILSTTQALQGRAAGVNMVNSSGLLGAAPNVQVRGPSSLLGGTQPLYVVDGVPLNDDVISGGQGGASGLNPLIDLNPNDVESITVLKDAAAVAIYGSRGTNGVILIKTKRGTNNQKTKVSLDYFTGISDPTDLPDLLNGDQFRKFRTDYLTARNLPVPTFPLGNFDWQDAVVRQGKVNSYSLSAAGGNERTRFYLGGTYYGEEGFTIGNDIRRLSGRLNVDHDISSRIKVGANLSLSNTNSDRIGTENSTFAPLTAAALFLPFVQPRDSAGNFTNSNFIANVLAIEALNTNDFRSTRSTGNAFAEFALIKSLKFRTDWGMDQVQAEQRSRSVNLISPGGTAFRSVDQNRKWLTTNTLTFDQAFGRSNLTVLLGQAFEKTNYDNISVGASGFASDRLLNVASGATPTTTFASRSAYALESYFGRLNYRFNDRYLFEGSVRRDGSSRFGAANQYGTFGAVSAGWIVSNEDFFSNVGFMNNLKLTASYGTSGNDRIGGDFPSLGLFGGGITADYNGLPGLNPNQIVNEDLKWEETRQLDIGIITSMFKSRINLNVNVYNKRTLNNLIGVPLPFTTGFPSVNRNIGEIENRGVDIELNTVNVRNKAFEWNTSLNIGFVKNKVLSLPTNKDEVGRDFLAISGAQRAIVGHSRNTFYMIRYVGINPTTGDAEWLDKNDKVTNNPVAADRKIVGSAIPKFTGGFTNSIRYKAFDFSAFFNFAYGNKVLIDGLRFTENIGSPSFNKTTNVLNYWKQAGDVAFAPRLGSPTAPIFNQLSTLQLQDGSYTRLKTVSLGYRLPRRVSDKLKVISSARFYVLAQNLFIIQDKDFRGPDAEVSANGGSLVQGESFFALPQARSFTFGVNVGF